MIFYLHNKFIYGGILVKKDRGQNGAFLVLGSMYSLLNKDQRKNTGYESYFLTTVDL